MVGTPGRCIWCDGELTGRRIKWCRPECEEAWRDNHWWGDARAAAKARDNYSCVRCGWISWQEVGRFQGLNIPDDDQVELYPRQADLEDWAVALGLLVREQVPELYDPTGWDQRRAIRLAAFAQLPEVLTELMASERRAWSIARSSFIAGRHQLEVNHIEPRRGGGYLSGCHHHLDNLETLCRPCHQDETNRQRQERASQKSSTG